MRNCLARTVNNFVPRRSKAFDIAVVLAQRDAGGHGDIGGMISAAACADDHIGRCIFADQIQRRWNDIFRRELLEQAFGEDVFGHAGACNRGNRIDADVIFRPFEVKCLGEAGEAQLCRAVIRLTKIAIKTG